MPSWLIRLRSFVRLVGGLRSASREDRDTLEEMRFHLDMKTAKNRAAGLSDADARRAAAIAFGGVAQWTEAARDEYRSRVLDEIAGDVRYAVRSLRRTPSFTAAVLLSLAIGIGATSTLYTVADRVVLRPLPYAGSRQLVMLWTNYRDRPTEQGGSSYPDFVDWTTNNPDLESAATFNVWNPLLSGDGASEPLTGSSVTPAFFHVLGVAPMLGRTFQPEETVEGGPHVALIAHSLWVRRFAADRAVLGKSITLGGVPYTIIGVMPPSFRDPEPRNRRSAELWRPLLLSPGARLRGSHFLRVLVRLNPGVSVEQARKRFDLIASRLAAVYPRSNRVRGVFALPMQDQVVGPSRNLLFAALGAAVFVLIIACANVATLVLARHSVRAPEVALRNAMGASRQRVARMLFVESVVLAIAGGVLGIGVALVATGVLRHLAPTDLPRIGEIVVDGRIVAVTMAITLGTAIVFGLLPAAQASRENIATLLQNSGVRSTRTNASRNAIVTLEIALALMLLVSTGLLAKSLIRLSRESLGLDTKNLLTFRIASPSTRFNTPGSHDAFVNALVDRLAHQPGIASAAATSAPPLTGQIQTSLFAGSEKHPMVPGFDMHVNSITAGYFAVTRVPVLAGREFGLADTAGGAPVAIINRAAAEQIFPGENPVGQHFVQGTSDKVSPTIVGVVADARVEGPMSEPKPELYQPMAQADWGGTDSYVVRTTIDPTSLIPAVRGVVRSLGADLAITDATSMSDLAASYSTRQRFYGAVFGTFAMIGLVLSAIGVYGLIAYTVVQRRREIAIRSALGAGAWDVLRRFVGHASALTLIGVVLGIGGSVAVARVLRTLLFGVAPGDASTIAVAAAVLVAVAIIASAVPVVRVRRMSLADALRSE